MTRETKAGIVVSCAFLSLVGVVVAAKMREQPEQPPGETDNRQTEKDGNPPAGETTHSISGPKADPKKSNPFANVIEHDEGIARNDAGSRERPPREEAITSPAPAPIAPPVADVKLPVVEPVVPLGDPVKSEVPAPVAPPTDKVASPPSTPVVPVDTDPVAVPVAVPADPVKRPSPDPVAPPVGSETPSAPDPIAPTSDKVKPAAPDPVAPTIDKVKPAVPDPVAPTPEPSAQPKGSPLPPISVVGEKERQIETPSPVSVAPAAEDSGVRRTRFTPAKSPTTPSVKVSVPVDEPPPIAAPGQPLREDVKPAAIKVNPIAPPDATTPHVDEVAPSPASMGKPQPLPAGMENSRPAVKDQAVPSPAAVGVSPPVAIKAEASIPPIPAPPGENAPHVSQPVKAIGTGGIPSQPNVDVPAPKVDVTRVWVLIVQPGDTYATVSKHLYGTEKYAVALQEYNKKEYDAPKDKLPEKVRAPAAEVLMQKYPSAIEPAAEIQRTGFDQPGDANGAKRK